MSTTHLPDAAHAPPHWPGKLVYSPKQAWDALGIGKSTFWRLVKAGELEVFAISTQARGVRADVLQAFIDRKSGRSPGAVS